MNAWWLTLDMRKRALVAVSLACLLALLAVAAWWATRAEMAVLFSDLSPEDAAVVAAELDKQKVPYAIAGGGSTLMVERSQVHATRLKLMARELPLHGAVGFELFNQSDLGMTEFMQKVNWQRALQGELTRTIAAFAQVRRVRVHLAMPEQGLFRQATSVPKAVVTLALREHAAMDAQQVQGIQRLVSAAVPGLVASEVTVVDERGVALTRSASQDLGGGWQLELKRDVEAYLARKAAAVLDGALGTGMALASVDVALNVDQVRTTTEDVIGAQDGHGASPTGVLVRERESLRDAGSDVRTPDGKARGGSTQRDAEYQAGRRVEHVVSQPGSIRRLQVVAVVKVPLDAPRRAQLSSLLGAAVGTVAERGDSVVLHMLDAGVIAPQAPAEPVPAAEAMREVAVPIPAWHWLLLAAGVGAAGLLAAMAVRRGAQPALTQPQRQLALGQVRRWLEAEPAGLGDPARWTTTIRENGRDA